MTLPEHLSFLTARMFEKDLIDIEAGANELPAENNRNRDQKLLETKKFF